MHRRGINAFRLLYENEGGFENTEIDFDNYRIREIRQVPVNNTYITLHELKYFINSEYKRIIDQSGEALNTQTSNLNFKSNISDALHEMRHKIDDIEGKIDKILNLLQRP